MHFRMILNTILAMIILLSVTTLSLAEDKVYTPLPDNEGQEKQTAMPDFPYKAKITGDRVNIRSGPGTQYYSCGKLNTGDKVIVVGLKFSWSRVVAPDDCFSWISKQYVKIDPNEPGTGVVTGDRVRVYAGSPNLIPMHSTEVQTWANTGDRVELLGEEQGGYYKIKPLEDCYLWVRTDYVQPIIEKKKTEEKQQEASEEKTEEKAEKKKETEEAEEAEEKVAEPNEPEKEAVTPVKSSVEEKMLEKYNDLQEKVKKEKEKPLVKQDFSDIKIELEKIANTEDAGKAAKYAEYALQSIKRHEEVIDVLKAVRMQEAQLYQTKEKIQEAKQKRLAKVKDLGQYEAIGRFEKSNVYSPKTKRFKLVGEDGKIKCYAQAISPARNKNLEKYIGKKVGLKGNIKPNPATGGAVIYFKEIEVVELK